MNPWIIFLIGVLVGWLVEWIIDWVYWRRKGGTNDDALDEARQELTKLKARLAIGGGDILPDELERVKGIGPVIKKKLNQNGITTFAELSAISPQRLTEIVGEGIRRLADEDEIIHNAKKLADLF